MARTVGEAKVALEKLRPKHAVHNDGIVKNWIEEVNAELDALEQAGIAIPIGGTGNQAQVNALKQVGMEPPQTAEESLRVYLTLRGVVHFWKRKLGQLKSESETFVKLEKQLHESGRATGATGRRTGVGRFQ